MKKNLPTLLQMLVSLCLMLSYIGLHSLNANEPPPIDLSQAQELLKMPVEQANEKIKYMNPNQTAELISKIRHIARPKNPDMDRLYLLIRHLANIQSTALAQKRLENLLWVIGLSLFLFCSFLVYILITQKQVMNLLTKATKQKTTTKTKNPLYRGETNL